MKLSVTPAAVAYFKEEWGFEEGDFIRIYTRYGGSSTIHEAFSLGITKEHPKDMALTEVIDGITFYMERDDIWYLKNYDLIVDFNEASEEVTFKFTEE